MTTVIYPAQRILTMNPSNPEATHVAVRGDRILGTGGLEELAGWGEHTLDDRFADKVLMPGLVEGRRDVLRLFRPHRPRRQGLVRSGIA